MKDNNLFLIGMMGSWKSTVGRKLAVALDLEFIDTDDALEEVTEMKVADLFQEFGKEKFREMETAFFVEKAKQSVEYQWKFFETFQEVIWILKCSDKIFIVYDFTEQDGQSPREYTT